MGREKKRAASGKGPGGQSKERHRKNLRHSMSSRGLVYRSGSESNLRVLNPRPEVPSVRSKHQSYYELVENKDKKKKLEIQITNNREPPPGYEFVPIGNPELTQACKEMSREQDAMVFIVSTDKHKDSDSLAHQVNRIGHHMRQAIVEQAREALGDSSDDSATSQRVTGVPEPIPNSQEEINEQADKAIRDLFPRIPNTDRQMIIEHSFKMGAHRKRGPLVGLAQDISLSRRVQLAVLAHIRHMHTRYDQLLKETTYLNARRAVEPLCLDILVKWRGDEETGRDQLDEILREVIVISDSEGEEDDDDDNDEHDNTDYEEEEGSAAESGDAAERHASRESTYSPPPATIPVQAQHALQYGLYEPRHVRPTPAYISSYAHNRKRHDGGGDFDRYRAALAARWGEAQVRVRRQEEQPPRGNPHVPGPYDPVPRHEAPPQERYQHLEAASHVDYQHDHDVRYDNTSRGYERTVQHPGTATYVESGSHLVPQMYAYEEQRPLDAHRYDHSPSEIPRPSGNFDQPLHVQRRIVSSEQARDYLLPSIETTQPPARPQPLGPQYHHAASSYDVALPDTTHARPNKRHSPTWSGDAYATTKRRRFMDDDASMHRDSPSQVAPHHHASMQELRDPLSSRAYAGDENRASTPRPYHYGAPPPNIQLVPVERPSVHHGRFPSDSRPVPIGDRSRPIVVEDWDRRPEPRPTPIADQNRRERSAAGIRLESVRPSGENRRSTSRRPERDHFARYRAVHESSLAGPVHETENSAYFYDTRSHPANAAEPAYTRASPPRPSHQLRAETYNTETGPVPQFVRETGLQSYPYPTGGHHIAGYEPGRGAAEAGEFLDHHGGQLLQEPTYVQYRDRRSQQPQPPDSGSARRHYGYNTPYYQPPQ